MNKLLTTITLLCFSVAANAEIYICESELVAELRGTENISGEYTRGRLIINTDDGFKSYLQGQSINSEDKYISFKSIILLSNLLWCLLPKEKNH